MAATSLHWSCCFFPCEDAVEGNGRVLSGMLAVPINLRMAGLAQQGSCSIRQCKTGGIRKLSGSALRARAKKRSYDPNPEDDLSDDQLHSSDGRQKALEAAMHDINGSFGKGSVAVLGRAGGALVETFPSGCLTLDLALGGGYPKGRIVEIYGPESSGKTTLALHAIAEIQKQGGNAMLVDAEHCFDPYYSKNLGVDVENLIVCQPDSGEMALETADRMCRSGAVDIIVIDSVSALTPRAEIEGEIGMQQMGLQARLMSQALRKMSTNAARAGCTIIFLNQIRYKVAVMYGNPEVTSGGLALKFFASLRIDIRNIGKIKSPTGDDDVGIKSRVRVQKSKVSRPYKQAEFDIIFGEGICRLGCMLDSSEAVGVVVRKGAWYSFGEIRLGQGRDKVVQFLRDYPAVCADIEKAVRERIAEIMTTKRDYGGPNNTAEVYAGLSDEEMLSEESLGEID
ncbi:hypothetical protein M758_5G120500 [Ceratodon purpureus]|nr:hypothetical protein M758_5G120500 [Ceratodon purpureus]